jgi:hypothetical protein
MAAFLNQADVDDLATIYGSGDIPTWGVTPGVEDANRKKWERARQGDIALFARDKHIVASATVAHLTHNAELATEIWETNSQGAIGSSYISWTKCARK